MTQKIFISLLFCSISFSACSTDNQNGFSPNIEEDIIEKDEEPNPTVRSTGLETNSISVKFYEDKIQTAKFYFKRVLPRAENHFKTAITGSDYIMNFKFN